MEKKSQNIVSTLVSFNYKSILFLVFLTIISFQLKSQDKGDIRFGINGQVAMWQGKMLPQFGLVGEYFLNHKFSLNYRYSFGLNPYDNITAHINPSILGLAFASYTSLDLLIYTFFIPEGVCYHVYPNEKLEIAPYINPLGAEINWYEDSPILLSCAFGVNLHIKPVEKFYISPNIGATVIYKNGEITPSYGLSLNYLFSK